MKKTIMTILMILLLAGVATATEHEENFSTPNTLKSSGSFPNLQVQSLKYEPYPVNPGEYFTLWIKVENIGLGVAPNATFELMPEFPFSLDSNEEAVKSLGKFSNDEPAVLEYKVRTSENAVKGTNVIKLRYNTDGGQSRISKEYDIIVDDAQTDFDLVIQEVSGGEASIAIANIGENVAYSVIVRIPEQEPYAITGTDGQMVGNLESGDYTLVGFSVTKKTRNDDKLKVRIDYTDTIGERRSVNKFVSFPKANSGTNTTTTFARNGAAQTQTTTQYYQQWWFWTIIIVIGYTCWRIITRYMRHRQDKEEKKSKK